MKDAIGFAVWCQHTCLLSTLAGCVCVFLLFSVRRLAVTLGLPACRGLTCFLKHTFSRNCDYLDYCLYECPLPLCLCLHTTYCDFRDHSKRRERFSGPSSAFFQRWLYCTKALEEHTPIDVHILLLHLSVFLFLNIALSTVFFLPCRGIQMWSVLSYGVNFMLSINIYIYIYILIWTCTVCKETPLLALYKEWHFEYFRC